MYWFLFSILSLTPNASNATWQWPINTGHGATSSFGEYRGARFHMGLDFSTGGVEGEPIKPARDGRVIKIRAQKTGYGRVIYLAHKDRYSTVYAHLAAFGPKISLAIRELGYEPSSYFGTLLVDLPVTTEELLAYSGESGAGMPHFHFEVRDSRNRPVDPLSLSFQGPSPTGASPVLEGLYLLPLNRESRVNGGEIPHQVSTSQKNIQASGAIGIQVLAYLNGARGSRLGCRGIRVYQSDRLIGEWLPEAIDFDVYRNAGLVFDQVRSGFGPTRFSYCFDGRAAFLPGVEGFRHLAPIQVTQKENLHVDIRGLSGEWRRFSFALNPEATPITPSKKSADLPVQPTSLETVLSGDRFFFNSATIKGTLQTPTKMVGLEPGRQFSWRPETGFQSGKLIWRTKAGNLARIAGMLPESEAFTFPIGSWRLRGRNLPRIPATALLLEPADPKIQSDVLEYKSPVLRFGREGLPSRGLQASFDPAQGESSEGLGLYAWSSAKKSWRYWGGPSGKGAWWVDLDYLTPVVIARDMSPPRILKPKFHDYFTGRRIVIPVRDRGSGVDADSILVEGPGGRIEGEYDRDRAWIILPENQTAGPWTVSLRDRAGLPAKVSRLRL